MYKATAKIYEQAFLGSVDTARARLLDFIVKNLGGDGGLWFTGTLANEEDILKYTSWVTRGCIPDEYLHSLSRLGQTPLVGAANLDDELGSVSVLSDVIPPDKLKNSSFWLEHLSLYQIENLMGYLLVDESAGIFTLLSVAVKKHRGFGPDERERFSLLCYHATKAFNIAIRTILPRNDSSDVVAFVCTSDGGIVAADASSVEWILDKKANWEGRTFPSSKVIQSDRPYVSFSLGGRKVMAIKERFEKDLFIILVRKPNVLDALTQKQLNFLARKVIGSTADELAEALYMSKSNVYKMANRVRTAVGGLSDAECRRLMIDYGYRSILAEALAEREAKERPLEVPTEDVIA